MSDYQNKQTFQEIENWLSSYLKGKAVSEGGKLVADKIKEKIAEKLGVKGFVDLINGEFPAAKIASFASGVLKWIWYEGYYVVNGQFLWNPTDPAKDPDNYVEYLLYSWGHYLVDKKINKGNKMVLGGPGYIYYQIKW